MKKIRKILFRALYFTGKLLSWRQLALLAGASLLTSAQSCRQTRKMCYEVVPVDTVKVTTSHNDSLYQMIDCYEMPNYPDSVKNNPDQNESDNN